MTTRQSLAHRAYQTYTQVMVPLAPWGIPSFAQLPALHQRAWEAVAVAVLEAWQAHEQGRNEERGARHEERGARHEEDSEPLAPRPSPLAPPQEALTLDLDPDVQREDDACP